MHLQALALLILRPVPRSPWWDCGRDMGITIIGVCSSVLCKIVHCSEHGKAHDITHNITKKSDANTGHLATVFCPLLLSTYCITSGMYCTSVPNSSAGVMEKGIVQYIIATHMWILCWILDCMGALGWIIWR